MTCLQRREREEEGSGKINFFHSFENTHITAARMIIK
jgi:hypothetical protein